MRSARVWPVAMIAAALLAACNALTGLGDDYALAPADSGAAFETGGSGSDADAHDGAIDVLADGAIDAALDGGGPMDFSCDAGLGGEVLFCTDFESPVTWDGNEQSGGTWAIAQGAGKDASGALHAHASETNVSRKANVWKTLALTEADDYLHYEVFFEFRTANKSLPYAALGVLAFTQPVSGLPYYGVAVHPGAPYPKLDVVSNGAIQPGGDAGRDQPLGSWHRCLITFDRPQAASTYDVALYVDEQLVDARSGFDTLDPQTAELRLGILFGDTNPGTIDVYIDNVVVRGRTN